MTHKDPQFFTELGDVLTFRVSRVWFSELFDSAKPLIRLMSRVSPFSWRLGIVARQVGCAAWPGRLVFVVSRQLAYRPTRRVSMGVERP